MGLKRSKIAINLRNRKWIYETFLRLKIFFNPVNTESLQSFILFIGYPRSGSSTLGSILDAHKNIIISHELNVLQFIKSGYSNKSIFYLIRRNSQLFNKTGRTSSGYKGLIINQYNGIADPIRIIGDKKAGKSTAILNESPELLMKLSTTVKVPVKCIHIIRNPFDMITTQAYGGNEKKNALSKQNIHNAIDFCFKKINTINNLLNKENIDLYTIRHENLLLNSKKELILLFKWLEIDVEDEYLEDCLKHLYNTPNKSRIKYKWSEKEISIVEEKMKQYPFLEGYHFYN